MTETEDSREWKELKLDGEVIGFSRQISDCVCVVVKRVGYSVLFRGTAPGRQRDAVRGARIRHNGCRR